jgi:Predicted pyridoxal phosphate-dependent enzyme apparently involved in regulation of cell wall biogenesis
MIDPDSQILMVDLKGQYLKIKPEIDNAIQSVIDSSVYINGLPVGEFAANLENYTGARHVIPVANGTDALQIALMALELHPGDEVIVPAFTYIASAEVIALLGFIPVMVDVDYDSFNVTAAHIQKAITPKTRAIIAVHLFGQSCPMEEILQLAEANDLFVWRIMRNLLGIFILFLMEESSRLVQWDTLVVPLFSLPKTLVAWETAEH